MHNTLRIQHTLAFTVVALLPLVRAAEAGMAYTTLQSLSVNSAMTGPLGTWTVNRSYTGPSTDLSWYGLQGTSPVSYYGGGSMNLRLRQNYAGWVYNAGFVDEILMQHDVGGSQVGSGTGSATVVLTFSQNVAFHSSFDYGSYASGSWSENGNVISNGTVLGAGTHTLSWNYTFSLPSGTLTRGYNVYAYIAPSAVPAPSAAALLGAAGLLGRRRRA